MFYNRPIYFTYNMVGDMLINTYMHLFQAQTAVSAVNYLGSAVIPKAPPAPTTIVMEPLPLWQLASSSGYYVKLAGIMGASAVALGAYGAHCR